MTVSVETPTEERVSAETLKSMMARDTDEVYLLLITIDHPTFTTPIRVVNNTEDVVSNGNTFVALPFEAVLPTPGTPTTTLKIDNVDREITDALIAADQADGKPSVTLEIVVAQRPDVVELGPFPMVLDNAPFDQLVVSGELSFGNELDQAYPGGTFNLADYPALAVGGEA